MDFGDPNRDGRAALALWADFCAQPTNSEAWREADAPTFLPFDALVFVRGVDAIMQHLTNRQLIYGTLRITSDPFACWNDAGSVIVAAEGLLCHRPRIGGEETRRVILMIAATTVGSIRLVHVTEAVPAVLPLVIESYRRPPTGPVQS